MVQRIQSFQYTPDLVPYHPWHLTSTIHSGVKQCRRRSYGSSYPPPVSASSKKQQRRGHQSAARTSSRRPLLQCCCSTWYMFRENTPPAYSFETRGTYYIMPMRKTNRGRGVPRRVAVAGSRCCRRRHHAVFFGVVAVGSALVTGKHGWSTVEEFCLLEHRAATCTAVHDRVAFAYLLQYSSI